MTYKKEVSECSTMVVHDLPKVETRVRFPSLAQASMTEIPCSSKRVRNRVGCLSVVLTEVGSYPLKVNEVDKKYAKRFFSE